MRKGGKWRVKAQADGPKELATSEQPHYTFEGIVYIRFTFRVARLSLRVLEALCAARGRGMSHLTRERAERCVIVEINT